MGAAAIEFSLRAALMKRKITPTGPGIRGMSVNTPEAPELRSTQRTVGSYELLLRSCITLGMPLLCW